MHNRHGVIKRVKDVPNRLAQRTCILVRIHKYIYSYIRAYHIDHIDHHRRHSNENLAFYIFYTFLLLISLVGKCLPCAMANEKAAMKYDLHTCINICTYICLFVFFIFKRMFVAVLRESFRGHVKQ